MSAYVDMMLAAEDRRLGDRLEKLTGIPAEECLPRYQATAGKLERAPTFERALRRSMALADRRRLLALALIRAKGELCACEIQAALGISHPAVSHQMGILVSAGLVASEKRGKWVRYRLVSGIDDLLR